LSLLLVPTMANDGVDYSHLPTVSLEEIYEASKTAIEVLLRLHGLDEAPEDCAHVFYDELDRVMSILGLREAMVSPYEISDGQERSA
jgi:hypothetical protein